MYMIRWTLQLPYLLRLVLPLLFYFFAWSVRDVFVRLRTAVMFRVVDRYLLVHYRDAAAVHAWPVRGIVCQALFPGELRLVMCPVRYI